MTITAVTLAVACVDGLVGAAALWLLLRLFKHLRKDGHP
jgi:hypothetical protein